MQRNFLRGLLVCLIPCLVAAMFAVRPEKYRLGVDLAGGTILVYKINLERTEQMRKAAGQTGGQQTASAGPARGLTPAEMAELAAQIKRRIDPTDIKNVTVRPLGDSRIEIILPTGGAAPGKENLTAEEIEETKRLISQMGVLEFRILANGADDKEGIAAARARVDAMSTEELRQLALEGKPPPGPEEPFTVEINDTKAKVRYLWSELGPEYRADLGLSNVNESQPFWQQVAQRRAGGKTFGVRSLSQGGYELTDDPASATEWMYSRKCESREVLAKDEAERERLKRENPGKSGEEIEKLLNPKKFEYFVLTRVSDQDSLRVVGDVSLTATVGTNPKTFDPSVDFSLNSAGAQVFGKITRRNKPSQNNTRHLAIILDEQVMSAPTIQSEITSRGQITGRFDRKTVERQVHILRSGALSAQLVEKPVSENTIGPTLGKDTIQKGTTAIGLAFLTVLAFMLFYYRFAGMVACIALFANLLLTVGFMVAVNAAFTLPGLAGLVLTLGMAVDANVLIYERLREERDKGANLATAIRNGYDRAFLTIIDTHLTSIFTAIVLYTFGNDQLKGFAISLTVGLVISLFTSLYFTRLMFDFWLHKKWLTELKMLRLFGKLNMHPMRFRYIFFPLTAALTVAGLVLFGVRGEAGLNVDFRGGTVFEGKLREGEERALTTVDGKLGFRELLSEQRQREVLKPVAARWDNRPASKAEGGKLTAEEILAVGTYDYTISYAGGSTSTVTLTQAPAGAEAGDEKAMERDLIGARDAQGNLLDPNKPGRAGELPDVSVEQTYRADEPKYPDGKSRHFTIRTTERQPELVRVTLDRLLRDENGQSLMAGAKMDVAVDGPRATLTFTEPTSPAYVQELLTREFRREGLAGADTPVPFKLVRDKDTEKEGRYTKMVVDASENTGLSMLKEAAPPTEEGKKAKAAQAEAFRKTLAATEQAFESAPEPERLEVFDSQMASETREKAFWAIVVSWIAILLYLWFRFGNWTFGLAAVICLIHDLCFTIGAIAVCHYLAHIPVFRILGVEDFKIDLAAVAALLTLVGYSVNEIIVNFARVREVRGKNPALTPQMINDSVNQTLSRTILTAMTVFLVSIVLYAFGGEGVHLFAFVMMMGVMVATYSSIFVACPLLLFLGEGRSETAEDTTAYDPDAKDREATEEEVVEG
jgi:SecD/SecF fusion protein